MGKIIIFKNYTIIVKKKIHGSYGSYPRQEITNGGGAQNCP